MLFPVVNAFKLAPMTSDLPLAEAYVKNNQIQMEEATH